MEQCRVMLSGRDGRCIRDPFYKDVRSALDYQPLHGRKHAAKPQAEQ